MIEGLDKLQKQLGRIKKVNPHSLLAGALVLQRYSMENAPVLTGFLRNSHESVETPTGAEMRVNADYAYHQEFGNSKMPGKAYVRRAIDEHSGEIVTAVKEQIEKDIKGNI